MKILLPIRGGDPFFPQAEYFFPKPLVEVRGQPMIQRVINGLRRIKRMHEFVFVLPDDECRNFSLDGVVKIATEDQCRIVRLKTPTRGAICSCLWAIEQIDPNEPLIIANSDQVIETDLNLALDALDAKKADAGVVIFKAMHPRWSYVRVDDKGYVLEAAEKRVISPWAMAGFYYFRKASFFFDAAKQIILDEVEDGGAYYVSTALNYLILDGMKVATTEIPTEALQSWYSPQQIANYERKHTFSLTSA